MADDSVGNKQATVYSILLIISFGHFLNDMIQSVIPSVYPILRDDYNLSFLQIGIITFVAQMTSSIMQPVVGRYTDRHPHPYSLTAGMMFTLAGILLLSVASSFGVILLAVATVGIGSAVFHPESSRIAQNAAGVKKGLGQSIFQVGGNGGTALGPLLAAVIILPFGQKSISWFAIAALVAIGALSYVGRWYKTSLRSVRKTVISPAVKNLSPRRIRQALFILCVLTFSKYFYMASMTSYFTFFLMDKFGIDIKQSQLCLFAFLAAVAAGTLIGGAIGDRYGRKLVIWWSILGAAPFALATPLCQLRHDDNPRNNHRTCHIIGILRHTRLRDRTEARQGWDDSRTVFRSQFRTWRHSFRIFRMACRPDKHWIHFSAEHTPAAPRHCHGSLTRHRVSKKIYLKCTPA